MSKQYFRAALAYDNGEGQTSKEDLWIEEDNSRDRRKVVNSEGESPILSGTDWYIEAVAAALQLMDKHRSDYNVNMEKVSFQDLPKEVQQAFDYQTWKKINPMFLKEYPEAESGYFEVHREPLPKGYDESEWLHSGRQPFDTIFVWTDNPSEQSKTAVPGKRENGKYLKDCYTACPVCGCRETIIEPYNHLRPDQLAGTAGFIETCKECGYSHQVITMMS